MSSRHAQIRTSLKAAGLTLIAAAILSFWYVGSAVLSATIPAGGRTQAPAEDEPQTYLCEAPFHTDIALPLRDALVNWERELQGALPPWMPPDTYLLFGWGDSVFFTRVLEPGDLTAGRALGALAGLNPAALRIVPVDGPSVEEYCAPITVDTEGRAALIAHIQDTFRFDADGVLKTIETPVPGEILVRARGRYSVYNTCNQWTAAALGKAGLPRAHFAPFSFSVTKPLKRAGSMESGSGAKNALD